MSRAIDSNWIECVLNLSEGRRTELLIQFARVIEEVAGVWLLGWTADADHNRSVYTFVARDLSIVEAARRIVLEAEARLDVRLHEGIHPRIGAVDVIPFVPLGRTPRWLAQDAAQKLARQLGHEPGLPVFLYSLSASRADRRELSSIRRGGLEGLEARLQTQDWKPDCGPRQLHPRLGAVAVGARDILIAFNIFLASADLDKAKRIARKVRESSGGLPKVQALGLYLRHRDQVQVSMNLTDYRTTGMRRVFDAVSAEAGELSLQVSSSEVIGYVPAAALPVEDGEVLRIENREPYILEERMLEVLGEAGLDASGGRTC